eukprot:gene11342-13889_t
MDKQKPSKSNEDKPKRPRGRPSKVMNGKTSEKSPSSSSTGTSTPPTPKLNNSHKPTTTTPPKTIGKKRGRKPKTATIDTDESDNESSDTSDSEYEDDNSKQDKADKNPSTNSTKPKPPPKKRLTNTSSPTYSSPQPNNDSESDVLVSIDSEPNSPILNIDNNAPRQPHKHLHKLRKASSSPIPDVVTTEYVIEQLALNVNYEKIVVLIQKSRNKTFKFLSKNLYVERKEKILEHDDMYFCNCPAGSDCGDDCLNRKSYIECNENCINRENCRNQRFQNREYTSIIPFYCGKKGWGLKTKNNVKKNDFIMEYCGEVISKTTCLQRMQQSENEKYFYYLTLDSKECLDASKKGNLARFINHSCDPNCETQKWTVDGEIKIGIFAIKDIPQDTELTFDYNYERFGAAKQVCYCNSANCRGFLGEKNPKKENIEKIVKPIQINTTLDHNEHVKFLFNEKADGNLYQTELSTNLENQYIGTKKLFLLRNTRLMKHYYLSVYQKCFEDAMNNLSINNNISISNNTAIITTTNNINGQVTSSNKK